MTASGGKAIHKRMVVGLEAFPQTSLSTIIDTLQKIAHLNIIHNNNNEENDEKDIIDKQKALESSIQTIQIRLESSLKSSSSSPPQVEEKEGDGGEETKEKQILIPLHLISNAKAILQHCERTTSNEDTSSKISTLKQQLEQNLQQYTKLSFPSSSSASSQTLNSNHMNNLTPEEKKAYQKRIEYLKLNLEERKYSNLTRNLDVTPKDDQTLSSMLYASSVGMNMIVAPISIGVLMYFFAGKLFLWIFGSTPDEHGDNPNEQYIRTSNQYSKNYNPDGQLNIHGVIVGVISGVIMLFIEMILFVIRNHEMDRHLTEKKKKGKKNPFGYDAKSAKRTFHG